MFLRAGFPSYMLHYNRKKHIKFTLSRHLAVHNIPWVIENNLLWKYRLCRKSIFDISILHVYIENVKWKRIPANGFFLCFWNGLCLCSCISYRLEEFHFHSFGTHSQAICSLTARFHYTKFFNRIICLSYLLNNLKSFSSAYWIILITSPSNLHFLIGYFFNYIRKHRNFQLL